MRLFDVYLAVDWSARNHPSPAAPTRDALWVGERMASGFAGSESFGESYWRTRHACTAYLRSRLLQHLEAGRRVFVGFDFAFGYPAGYTAALGLRGSFPPWRRLWGELRRLVIDDTNNENNRFEVASTLNTRCGGSTPGPLWGCPPGTRLPALAHTSPGYPYPAPAGVSLERLRLTDRQARGVQPVWKLYGSASVGGQTLVGISAVCRLRDDPALAPVSRIWPFETSFTPVPTSGHKPTIIFAEIWPGLVPELLDPTLVIRDQAQVRTVTRWLSELDAAGRLGTLFAAPPDLSLEALSTCLDEEGWILGSGLWGDRSLKDRIGTPK